MVCVIGDAHYSPGVKSKVPLWIGRYLTDMQPDAIIHIGDLGDFDSITRWIEKGSHAAKSQYSIDQDIEAVAEAFKVFHENYFPENDPHKHVTLGNHDERLWLYENLNPASYGTYTNKFTGLLDFYGWGHSPFGVYHNYMGVDFVHAPKHEGGKAIAGKTASQRIANDSRRCVVYGHTHRLNIAGATKLGNHERVTAVGVGCSLPWGLVKDYAKHNANGWWWGIVLITIYKGRIEGILAKPMFELEAEYD